MVTRAIAATAEVEGKPVGQVFADFEVENLRDVYSEAPTRAVRSVSLKGMMLDTGATHLCLPAELIEQLGLPFAREVPVQTAVGVQSRRVFALARVKFEDRAMEGECVELPRGAPPLLGAIPMEAMGIEPDLQNRRVRKLPLGPEGTYITA